MQEEQTIHLTLAHDGGNGYMKDRINGKTTIFPSVIADFMPGMQNVTVDSNSREDVENFLDDFINNMDVTTNSKGINDNGRYLVGQAAAFSDCCFSLYCLQCVEYLLSSSFSLA